MNLLINLILISLTFTLSLCLPDGCNCRLGVMPRIVRGVDSEHVPWQVSVKANGEHKCSGLILNDELILTVSSCINGYEIKELEILAGVTRLNETTENNYKIKSVSLTGFSGNGPNNTAILKLSRKLKFENLKIQKACLRMFDKKYGGFLNLKSLLTTGWGFDEKFILDQDGRSNKKEIKPTNNLKKAYVKFNGLNKDFFNVRPRFFIRQSLCTFDEGSPLMNQENGRAIVIGFADDIIIKEHNREPGKFVVCDGEGRFIKLSQIEKFLSTNFDTSEMCLEYSN